MLFFKAVLDVIVFQILFYFYKPQLAKEFPNAKFVDIVRHPKDTFISGYGILQAGLTVVAGGPVDLKTQAQSHLRFWDKFTEAEMSFFLDDAKYGSTGEKRSVITFNEYVKDQEAVARRLYSQWGYEIKGTKFETRLLANREKFKNYKKNAGYSNPTLEDLGLDKNMISKRYADYITKFKIPN